MQLEVRRQDDVVLARQEVKTFAAPVTFRRQDLVRLEVIVAELASNMVKHAGSGTLRVERLEVEERKGIRVVAEDRGPGIADTAAALTPGVSTAGSFGDGLAAVQELADAFALHSRPGVGTRVEVEKWAR